MLKLDHTQIAIPPGTEARARAFWCDLLGLTELKKPEALEKRGGLWLQLDGAELHLGVQADFAPAEKAHPGFLTPDLDDTANRLKEAGCTLKWDDLIRGRRRFFCTDPFGNRLEFIQKD